MRHKRILIIDDDVQLQAVLKRRLESHGFECINAFTVASALEQLKKMPPDLVLLDLGFRTVDGTAFLQHAKEWLSPDEKVPPVIILSGHDEKEIVDFVLNEGAVGFIAKPFETDELLSMVRTYI